mgnify:CR=1 FL=1
MPVIEIPILKPKAGSTWSLNFRPAQARVTFNGGTGPIRIWFMGSPVISLGHNDDSVSPQVIDLDFSDGLDIYALETFNTGIHITAIEFR